MARRNPINVLKDLNQLAKRCIRNSTYLLYRNVAYQSTYGDIENIGYYRIELIQQFDLFDKYVFNGVINGDELYRFLQEPKKHITGISANPTQLIIRTDKPSIMYRSEHLTQRYLDYIDHFEFRHIDNNIELIESDKRELDQGIIKSIVDSNSPVILALGEDIMVSVFKNLILLKPNKKSVNYNIKLYHIQSNNTINRELIIFELNQTNKTFSIQTRYPVIPKVRFSNITNKIIRI